MYRKLTNVVSAQGANVNISADARSECPGAEKKSWKGVMGGQKLEIWIASTMLILPMVTRSALLIGLVYVYRMPNNSSSYSHDNGTALPLESAYFVNYSSTTLVYIASLSSTLSTLLIPAAMLLYSFPLARDLAQNSDRATVSNLPSPYQLELLIRMIDGRLMVLGSYILYACGSKQRRTNIVPVLRHAFATLIALVLLAVLIALADLWLHLGTKSVQYLELRPEQPSQAFAPGRGLNLTCLNDPDGPFSHWYLPACMLIPGDAVTTPQLVNETEFLRTAANYSDVNQVYLSDGYAVLGSAEPPLNLDFQATSFGSKTACRVVTGLCGAIPTARIKYPSDSMYNFRCNASTAGLHMTGNFLNLLAPINDCSLSTRPQVYDGSSGSDDQIEIILGENPINLNNFGIGFQYFNDAQKQNQTVQLNQWDGLGKDLHQLFWNLIWRVPFSSSLVQMEIQSDTNDAAAVGLSDELIGGSAGILSCETNISEVTYSFVKGTMEVTSSRTPRENASLPFVGGITAQWGYDQLREGIQQSFADAKSSEDFAARFATFYDQIVVSVPAGAMIPLPAINTSRRIETPVARVPKAPFMALVLLDLLYAITGLTLTISALLAMVRGRDVGDAQVRLSVAAVVAERFESPALEDDATEVGELYAERRGMATARVALGRMENGGRHYRKTIVKEREDDQ